MRGVKPPDIERVKEKIRLRGYDSNDEACTPWISLYDFIIFETQYNGQTYILTQRNWYKVEMNFLRELDNKIALFVKDYTGPKLKNWPSSKDEGEYNKLYSSSSQFLVLDRENFVMPGTSGRGKVEIADLFHLRSNSLIAVKDLNGSATLSHLFSQGSVSAALFAELDEYRSKFLEKVEGKWPGKYSADQMDDITFVYAIGTGRTGDVRDLLPFFSKVNLLRHAKRIRRLGFKVEIVKVTIK